MKYIRKTILLFGMFALAFACTDLDEELEDELTIEFSDNGVTVIDGATEGGILPSGQLGASYDRLRNGSAGHGSYWSAQTVSSDEAQVGQKGGDWFDGGIWLRMHRHTFGSANDTFNNMWNDAYGGIGEVNLALEGGLSPDDEAQAKTIRAFFYLRLLDSFGRVKLITSSGGDAPQSTRLDAFNFVESELLGVLSVPAITATLDLSGSALGTGSEPYIANQYAALGLLAKLYLNAEVYTGTPRYEEADWAATYIIDNGPYQLCGAGCSVPNLAKRPAVDTDPETLEGYAAVFAPNNQFNPEMIWSIRYDETSAGGMNFAHMVLHGPSQLTYGLDAQPWNGYQVLEEFYNSYEDGDARKEASFLVGPQTDFGGNALLDFASDDADLQVNYTPAINELEPNSIRESGARMKKFSFQNFGRNEMNNDFPILRLGQVHMIRAEARARAAADWSLSLPDVNALRDRATLGPLASIDADGFFDERGKEMFQESSRRTDMIRFGKFQDSWFEKTNNDATRSLFPIAQAQIDAAAGSLTQNPGY